MKAPGPGYKFESEGANRSLIFIPPQGENSMFIRLFMRGPAMDEARGDPSLSRALLADDFPPLGNLIAPQQIHGTEVIAASEGTVLPARPKRSEERRVGRRSLSKKNWNRSLPQICRLLPCSGCFQLSIAMDNPSSFRLQRCSAKHSGKNLPRTFRAGRGRTLQDMGLDRTGNFTKALLQKKRRTLDRPGSEDLSR